MVGTSTDKLLENNRHRRARIMKKRPSPSYSDTQPQSLLLLSVWHGAAPLTHKFNFSLSAAPVEAPLPLNCSGQFCVTLQTSWHKISLCLVTMAAKNTLCDSKLSIRKVVVRRNILVSHARGKGISERVAGRERSLKLPQWIIKPSVLAELSLLSAMCPGLFMFQLPLCAGNTEGIKGRIFTAH